MYKVVRATIAVLFTLAAITVALLSFAVTTRPQTSKNATAEQAATVTAKAKIAAKTFEGGTWDKYCSGGVPIYDWKYFFVPNLNVVRPEVMLADAELEIGEYHTGAITAFTVYDVYKDRFIIKKSGNIDYSLTNWASSQFIQNYPGGFTGFTQDFEPVKNFLVATYPKLRAWWLQQNTTTCTSEGSG